MDLLEKEWYIQAPWGRIAIIAWGDCYDPPVLLVHGFSDSAVSFRPLVSQLPKKYYYIGMELPGNGKSDNFPPGLMVSIYDLIYSVHAVAKHFRWKNFVYIGHSFGTIIGMIYNVCYPGELSKLVKIDPINLYGIEPEGFPLWYHKYFADFFKDYDKYNVPKEKATKIKWKEGIASIRQNRPLLSEEQAAVLLERLSEPAGDGLIRFTFDRRNKMVHGIPYSAEHIKKIFTAVPNPILTIVCEDSLKKKLFRNTAFLLDKSVYPNGNMRCVSVKGGHDVHISNPERLAPFIKEFLAKGIEGIDGKSKL